MKTLKSIVVAILFSRLSFGSLALSQGSLAETCDVSVTHHSLEVVTAWLKFLTGGNGAPSFADYWHENSVVILPEALPYGGRYSLAEQAAYGRAIQEHWDLSNVNASPTLHGACNNVFLEGCWSATARATGIKIDTPLLEIFTLQGDKIIQDELFFFDLAEVLEALGVQEY